jgi:hypothetical protein
MPEWGMSYRGSRGYLTFEGRARPLNTPNSADGPAVRPHLSVHRAAPDNLPGHREAGQPAVAAEALALVAILPRDRLGALSSSKRLDGLLRRRRNGAPRNDRLGLHAKMLRFDEIKSHP